MKPRSSNNAKNHKSSKKYVPTPEEAEIIKSYFLYNNYQDFNTWQQISKCRSEYEYIQKKQNNYECKILLKWDDSKMPILAQTAQAKNKRRAKKKVLYKIIENLIFQGLIGYGFKETDFIKKLPRRRKEDTSSESQQLQENQHDDDVLSLLQADRIDEALHRLTYENFESIWFYLLGKRDMVRCVQVLRRLQRRESEVRRQDLEYEVYGQQQWQDYCEKQFKYPFEDLTEILQYYQLQWMQQEHKESIQFCIKNRRKLPCESLQNHEGKHLFYQFYPIDKTLKFQSQMKKKSLKPSNSYFQLQIQIPKFEQDTQLLPYRIVQQIYDSLLYFSYDHHLIFQLLHILPREIVSCQLSSSSYYLNLKSTLVSQFGYLLHKKVYLPALSIQGMITRFNSKYVIFYPKEPQQILNQKLSKRINTNQFQEMAVFAVGEYVLLVSKLNQRDVHVGWIIQLSTSIKIKVPTLINCSLKEKYPFTMYKLANSKIYDRISKAIIHTSKKNVQIFQQNTCILVQPTTYPLLPVIYELITEWSYTNEAILLVSQHSETIHKMLIEKGFKSGKITSKFDQKTISKHQIICSTPNSVCCDSLKNYLFTRVIVEGAERISEMVCLLAIDKGCQSLYLLGDPTLPSPVVHSPFIKNKKQVSLMHRLLLNHQAITFESSFERCVHDSSIFNKFNQMFYKGSLNPANLPSAPIIKGFPWPSQEHRFALIHHPYHQQHNYLNTEADICVWIVANILETGFIDRNQIRCLTTSTNIQMIISLKISQYFRENKKKETEDNIKMVDFLTGSRFNQTDLCILMAGYQRLDGTHLNAILQESLRGMIVIGDLNLLSGKSPEWMKFMEWANKNKLILKIGEL